MKYVYTLLFMACFGLWLGCKARDFRMLSYSYPQYVYKWYKTSKSFSPVVRGSIASRLLCEETSVEISRGGKIYQKLQVDGEAKQTITSLEEGSYTFALRCANRAKTQTQFFRLQRGDSLSIEFR